MDDKIIQLADGTFETQVNHPEKAVLVDIWAEWCAPCKMIAPLLEDMADRYEDKLIVGKLNIDQNPETATALKIRSIPTLLLYREGKVIATQVGALSKSDLIQFLDDNL